MEEIDVEHDDAEVLSDITNGDFIILFVKN